MADTFHRLKSALSDRYTIEGLSGESDGRHGQFTDRLPSREFTRGPTQSAT